MKAALDKWFAWAGNHHAPSIRLRLNTKAGWALLAGMLICCAVLWVSPIPEEWRALQNLAAVLQAFMSGLVAAQWLPIWETEPSRAERVAPSAH